MVDDIAARLRSGSQRLRQEWERTTGLWRDSAAQEFEDLAVNPMVEGLEETAARAVEFAAAVRAAWRDQP